MPHESCPGYGAEPFRTLADDYPGEDAYPWDGFRTEWGPVFHRGRLDGTARLVAIGQDPAAHEAIARRILVGEAGRRSGRCAPTVTPDRAVPLRPYGGRLEPSDPARIRGGPARGDPAVDA